MKNWMKRIKDIPPDGEFYKRDTNVTFNCVYLELVMKGFTEDEAIDILERLYIAISDEFGG